MKKIYKIFGILSICLSVLIFISVPFIRDIVVSRQLREIDVEKFQNIIYDKEIEINNYLIGIASNLKNQSLEELLKNNRLIDNPGILKEKGYYFFIYQNDTLKYWSENTVHVDLLFSESPLRQKTVRLNNGWYMVNYIQQGNETIVGLILIKNKYPIENSFLKEHFHPDFGLPPSIKISLYSLSYSKDIYDIKNNPLLSLIPTSEYIELEKKPWLFLSLYLLAIILLFTGLNRIIREKRLYIIFLFLFFIGLRYLMIQYEFPSTLYSFRLFKPELYASSWFLPSLGDLFLHTIIVFFFSFRMRFQTGNKNLHTKLSNSRFISSVFLFFMFMLFFFMLSGIQHIIINLVDNSGISFRIYDVLSLDIYSIIAFLIIALLFGSYFILFVRLYYFISQIITYKIFWVSLLSIFMSLMLFLFITNDAYKYFPLITLFIVLNIFTGFLVFRQKKLYYAHYVFYIITISVFTIYQITSRIQHKNVSKGKIMVSKIANERDPIAEYMLPDIQEQIQHDEQLYLLVDSSYLGSDKQFKDIDKYLSETYFKGYLAKYNLDIVLCGPGIYFDPANELSNCKLYFGDLVESYGVTLPYSDYYFLNNQNGKISYLGIHDFELGSFPNSVSLYLEIESRLISEELGYPELLLDENLKQNKIPAEYSFAKYKNKQLIDRSGQYPYTLTYSFTRGKTNQQILFSEKSFNHLIYQVDSENIIVLTWNSIQFIDLLIAFSYLFLFFNILLLCSRFINILPRISFPVHFNFKNKLQIAMISILILSFFLVGGGNLYYNINQKENKHREEIKENIQSVLAHLQHIFSSVNDLTPDWRTKEFSHPDELLIHLSRIFYTDLNLYDTNGNILGSSRPELFEKELTGPKIDPVAFWELLYNDKAIFIHNESIGKLNFTSAYTPLKNENNTTLAYLNLPYFTNPGILRQEISTFIVTLLNIYVILFLIAIVIAIVIANKITSPLAFIGSKFREIELGKKNEQIVYNGRDEIGNIIHEYNRMVKELAESIKKLAQTERESAWREMAKQIAHEIKNPLTPMRLNIQFLQRSWINRDDDFDDKFDNATQSLIEQIDSLSAIAAEFSNFAKMPKAENEVFNLIEEVNNSITLFLSTDNVIIRKQYENELNIKVYADKKQISRVFINLIKNAIQAIPEEKNGIIEVGLEKQNGEVLISVRDNGTGIPEDKQEKIFMPNFTTKSSGMGMGLAIVKNIIKNAEGEIWFETKPDKGTTFFVKLPEYKE